MWTWRTSSPWARALCKRLFKEALDIDIKLPLKRLTYAEAMNRFGSDKPDTRFGMELFDLSDIAENCGFGVFANTVKDGGTVRGFKAENACGVYTRKVIDRLTEEARAWRAKGLAWVRLTDDGIASSFSKFMTEEEMTAINRACRRKNRRRYIHRFRRPRLSRPFGARLAAPCRRQKA